jgi:hypothetical protein
MKSVLYNDLLIALLPSLIVGLFYAVFCFYEKKRVLLLVVLVFSTLNS